MAKGILDELLDLVFDENWVGRFGEKMTERELKLVRFFGRSGKILRNIYVPKDNGETSEVDVVYITQKGIFVIESKNYSGWIFGDEKANYWTAMLPNKQKNRFYNPIHQNRSHIKWLRAYLGEDIPLFSIIVFSERCELKKVTVSSPDVYVIKREYTYATIRDIWDSAADVLDDGTCQEIYEKLKKLTDADEAVKQAHIDRINEKYKKGRADQEKVDSSPCENTATPNDSIDQKCELRCPKCGAPLILRTAKKGSHEGEKFYGCSRFPKCRYIQKIEEE